MADINRVIISGRLIADPQLHYVERKGQQIAVCRFTIGSDRDRSQQSDYIDILVWREYGESCANHLIKGQEVTIDGKLHTRFSTDGEKRKFTEVHAKTVKFGPKPRLD